MTPFDSWYSARIEPGLPRDMPPRVREIAKQQAATIWNAALEALGNSGKELKIGTNVSELEAASIAQEIVEQLQRAIDAVRAQVTP